MSLQLSVSRTNVKRESGGIKKRPDTVGELQSMVFQQVS